MSGKKVLRFLISPRFREKLWPAGVENNSHPTRWSKNNIHRYFEGNLAWLHLGNRRIGDRR